MKPKLAVGECFLQRIRELATEHFCQRSHGEEELRVSGNPTAVISGESAGLHYTVDVRVELQLLIPAMQHAEEAGLSAGILSVACDPLSAALIEFRYLLRADDFRKPEVLRRYGVSAIDHGLRSVVM